MFSKTSLLRKLVAASKGFAVRIAEVPSDLPVNLSTLLQFMHVSSGYLLGMFDNFKFWKNSAN